MVKKFLNFFISFIILNSFLSINIIPTYADEKIIIVIDPGHGGENKGADFNGIKEKDITLKVAFILKEELDKYSNFDTYITRKLDEDVSLKKRADIAKDCDADILLSIHFNASENHNRFGSEVWLSSVGKYYKQGYGIAYNILDEFESLGLANRGIKTRIGEGQRDYYGIIREAVKNNIPAMIIEHCFMDNKNDVPYLSEEMYINFAKADARALFNYYSSSESNKIIADKFADDEIIYPDVSPPENISLHVTENKKNNTLDLNISTVENESTITYFDYSIDGGLNWSELIQWNENNTVNKIIDSNNYDKNIIARVYNGYDEYSKSNSVVINAQTKNDKEDLKFTKKTIIFILTISITIIFVMILILMLKNNIFNKNQKL